MTKEETCIQECYQLLRKASRLVDELPICREQVLVLTKIAEARLWLSEMQSTEDKE